MWVIVGFKDLFIVCSMRVRHREELLREDRYREELPDPRVRVNEDRSNENKSDDERASHHALPSCNKQLQSHLALVGTANPSEKRYVFCTVPTDVIKLFLQLITSAFGFSVERVFLQ